MIEGRLGTAPDRSSLVLLAAWLILEEVSDGDAKGYRNGYRPGRGIEDAFTDENGRRLLSRAAVSEITERLWAEYEAFIKRLSKYRIVYLYVDGIAERLHAGTGRRLFADFKLSLLVLSALARSASAVVRGDGSPRRFSTAGRSRDSSRSNKGSFGKFKVVRIKPLWEQEACRLPANASRLSGALAFRRPSLSEPRQVFEWVSPIAGVCGIDA